MSKLALLAGIVAFAVQEKPPAGATPLDASQFV